MPDARVIWNPSSGSKPGVAVAPVDERGLRDVLERHRIDAEIVPTSSEADARKRVREAMADGCRAVIAAGGDGTAELVAGELLDTGAALGILPLGSVMNLARSLEIPRDLDEAAEIIAAGAERTIDVAVADDQLFYESAEVGFYAAAFPKDGASEGWHLRAIPRFIAALARYRPVPVVLRIDGKLYETTALLVTINNGPYGGLGFSFAPDAPMDDGQFDIRIFRNFSKRELLLHLGSIAFGRRAYAPKVETLHGASVVIETRGLPWRADGWTGGQTPATFAIRPRALRVIARSLENRSPDPGRTSS